MTSQKLPASYDGNIMVIYQIAGKRDIVCDVCDVIYQAYLQETEYTKSIEIVITGGRSEDPLLEGGRPLGLQAKACVWMPEYRSLKWIYDLVSAELDYDNAKYVVTIPLYTRMEYVEHRAWCSALTEMGDPSCRLHGFPFWHYDTTPRTREALEYVNRIRYWNKTYFSFSTRRYI